MYVCQLSWALGLDSGSLMDVVHLASSPLHYWRCTRHARPHCPGPLSDPIRHQLSLHRPSKDHRRLICTLRANYSQFAPPGAFCRSAHSGPMLDTSSLLLSDQQLALAYSTVGARAGRSAQLSLARPRRRPG